MADTATGRTAFPNPNQNQTNSPAPGNNNQPSGPQSQRKRKPRNAKAKQSPNTSQLDGAASDPAPSHFANSQTNSRSKQRQQSVAMGALPNPSTRVVQQNEQKQRPVSIGGNTTPLKEQAYAGPTFQASPAPSALPVPKFASRSVPNVAAHSSLEARMAGHKTPEEQSSPEADVVSPEPSREAQRSPLDFFFKAQLAENQSAKSAQEQSPYQRPGVPATEPRNSFQRSGKSDFFKELDGEGDLPSPKTMPPNRHGPPQAQMQQSPSRSSMPSSNQTNEDYTSSLKKLLFNGGETEPSQTATPPQTQRRPDARAASLNAYQTPSPFQRPPSNPTTPSNDQTQKNYSLHYGNRNLSPLFKATKHDSPLAKPSGLRHSTPSELASNVDSGVHMPTHNPSQTHNHPPTNVDPDNFSRNYLNQTIRANPSSRPGQQPRTHSAGTPQQPTPPSPYHQYHQPTPQQQPQTQHLHPNSNATATATANANASPRAGSAPQDVRTMEDDLRRMLKLNVLSG